MAKYIIKRLLLSIPVLFGITIITFAIIHLPSGGPTVLQSNMSAKVSADSVAKLRKLYDLDKPLHIQYIKWLGRVVRLDFGESFNDNRPVVDKIFERIPNTLLLNILSLFLIFIVAIPVGIYSAVKQGGLFDKTFSVITFLGYSIPTFWLALLLMLFFGVFLGVLPISGMRSPDADRFPLYLRIFDRLWHLILPVFV
ncbi:MAG: ABC transporter permease, partial [Candidatus Firestonebacteria bacterium]